MLLLGLCALVVPSLNAQKSLSKSIASKATNNPYTSVRVDENAYFFYHKKLIPTSYNNCLIETNSPRQLYQFYENTFRKIYKVGTYFYNDLFPENRTYSESEIEDVLKKYSTTVTACFCTDTNIEHWLRNRNTVEFLGIWESIYNPDFNYVEFDVIRKEAGLNSFKLSAKEWNEKTKGT